MNLVRKFMKPFSLLALVSLAVWGLGCAKENASGGTGTSGSGPAAKARVDVPVDIQQDDTRGVDQGGSGFPDAAGSDTGAGVDVPDEGGSGNAKPDR